MNGASSLPTRKEKRRSGRHAPALALILLASACGSSSPPAAPPARNAAPAASAPRTAAPAGEAKAASADRALSPADDGAPSGLSPSQRRAYAKGYADCRAGRYAPGNYPEAYRIGCAAAQDRAEAGRPQG